MTPHVFFVKSCWGKICKKYKAGEKFWSLVPVFAGSVFARGGKAPVVPRSTAIPVHVGIDLALVETTERARRYDMHLAIATDIGHRRSALGAEGARKLSCLGQVKSPYLVFTRAKTYVSCAGKNIRRMRGARCAPAARAVAEKEPDKRPLDVVLHRPAETATLVFTLHAGIVSPEVIL